jgi:hypothetical protein
MKGKNMRNKYAIVVALVVGTISLAALAEKQAPTGKVYLLKAGGKTIAELRVQPSATVAVESADTSGHVEHNIDTGTIAATGGAILKLTAGANSISVRADEIESVPDSQ